MEKLKRALDMARAGTTLQVIPGSMDGGAPRNVDSTSQAQTQSPTTQSWLVTMKPEHLREQRVVLPQEKSPAAQTYRLLRTQVLQRARAEDLRLIGIVGTMPGEGKTLTAVNLALAMAAEPNQTVLLVDLDLRRPSVATVLGIPPRKGVEAYLHGSADLAELFCRLYGVNRLAILPAFNPMAATSEVLADQRARSLLHELKSRYDDRFILIDLPPALTADDALTVAPELDAVIVVAAEGRTRREDLRRLDATLANVKIIGTVLNRASERQQIVY